jgi:translocation and assembly module TamA
VRTLSLSLLLPSLLAVLLNGPLMALAQEDVRVEGVRVAEAGPGLPAPLTKIVNETLVRFTLGPEADEADEERELRRAERAVREALATEGYFDSQLRFEPSTGSGPRYRLIVELGPLTRVSSVDLQFSGALTEPQFAARAAELRSAWGLPPGQPFRAQAWEQAKLKLLAAASDRYFATARIVEAVAQVDPAQAQAALTVQLDSGPAYTMGPLRVQGLKRYEASLVERYNPFKLGEPYNRARVIEFQQTLQDTPYFGSAIVTLDTEAQQSGQAPLRVVLREARSKRLSTGVGFETDTGAHLELAYRQNELFGRPWVWQSGLRIDQTGGFAYSDVLLPPRPGGVVQDSVGVLVEDSDIEEQHVRRWGVGAARTRTIGPRTGNNVRTKLSVNFEHENRRTPDTDWRQLNTLSTTYSWVRRKVDVVLEPRRGNVIRLEGTVGASGTQLDDAFLRGLGRIQQYFPVGARDVLIVRADLGYVQADSSDVVPSKFLFRTGGTTTVRGYDYESLGVKQGVATVGGRALAVGSVEYVHWLDRFGGDWGVATFVDVGDAADRFSELDPAVGFGAGVRYRTPAGPLAVDFAYGERENQFRVHFSVAIAF